MKRLPISPGSGYIRCDIRPSKRLQEAIARWRAGQPVPIPFAGSCRALIWRGLEADGIVPVKKSRWITTAPELRVVRTEGHDLREDGA